VEFIGPDTIGDREAFDTVGRSPTVWFTAGVPERRAALDSVPDALPLNRRSLSWRVNAEPIAFLGGARALLLQVAHPKVAAGVEQHSTYVSDPWGRLFRTIDVMAKLSFASPEASAAQAQLLERMHKRVVGTTDDGEPYHALDPDLLLWVWATLCDTALLMYEQVLPPLTPGERDQYYEEWKLVAYACGVPEGGCPPTWADFEAYMQRVIAEDLRPTDAARSVAHAAMVPPLPWPFGPLAAGPNKLVTMGMFPESLRTGFGFTWDARKERDLRRFLQLTSVAMRLTPRLVRELGFRYVVRRDKPLRFPWLQRRGAVLTARRMAELEHHPR
jgi:uncharacterized protein (DUF2236 family)